MGIRFEIRGVTPVDESLLIGRRRVAWKLLVIDLEIQIMHRGKDALRRVPGIDELEAGSHNGSRLGTWPPDGG